MSVVSMLCVEEERTGEQKWLPYQASFLVSITAGHHGQHKVHAEALKRLPWAAPQVSGDLQPVLLVLKMDMRYKHH